MGKRGMHQGAAFNANSRFRVTGICDIDPKRLDEAAAKLGNPRKSANAAELAKELKPDVFCFCTLPNLRLEFVKDGIDRGASSLRSKSRCRCPAGKVCRSNWRSTPPGPKQSSVTNIGTGSITRG